MKRAAVLSVLALLAALAAAAAPRNPFWRQGYEGVRHRVTLEPRQRARPVVVEEAPVVRSSDDDGADGDERLWNRASRQLRFGSTMILDEGTGTVARASVVINDLVYAVGDLVSVTFEKKRFTWRIDSVSTERKVRLRRLTHRAYRKNQ